MSWSAGPTAQPWAAGSWEVPSTRPLEVTLVEVPATLRRKTDPATGLALIDLSWGNAAAPGL